jgi:hypothetical protein
MESQHWLGLYFNSETMTWSLPRYKLFVIYASLIASYLTLLLSLLTFFLSVAISMTLPCSRPSFMPLKPLYSFFFVSLETMTKVVVAFLIRFGKICFSGDRPFLPLLWLSSLLSSSGSSLHSLVFYSDAAGGVFHMYEKLPHLYPRRGAASVRGQSPEDVWASSFLSWPPSLLSTAVQTFHDESLNVESRKVE